MYLSERLALIDKTKMHCTCSLGVEAGVGVEGGGMKRLSILCPGAFKESIDKNKNLTMNTEFSPSPSGL